MSAKMIHKHVLEICCGKDKYVFKDEGDTVKKRYEDITRGIQKGDKLYEFEASGALMTIVLPSITMMKVSRGIDTVY